MDDAGAPSRRVLVAFGFALLVFLAALVWAGTGVSGRARTAADARDTRTALHDARRDLSDLRARRARAVLSPADLATLGEVMDTARTLSQLDQQELAQVQRSIAAGRAGDVAIYNSAVGARNALTSAQDAATDALRRGIDEVRSRLASW